MRDIILRGKPLVIHDDEDISNAIARDGDYYEHEILDYIAQNYPQHKRIIDVGANIGNHTIFFSRFLEYTEIIAFEPDESNYALLVENMIRDGNKSDVIAVKAALGSYTGTINLFTNDKNFGMHQVSHDVGGTSVSIYPLDDFGFDDVSLIKIDVEYYEPYVLAGATLTIQQCKPLILIEDVDVKYAQLLPNYEIIEKWSNYRTYLYGWKYD